MRDLSETVLRALADKGLLLVQDKHVPSVVTMVTGETPRGSWWSHPKGRVIWAVLTELAEHPDVLFTKLVGAKVTLVHRRLWPALLTVASAREEWQVRGLSAAARELLASANESEGGVVSSGPAVKELEARLLVHAEEVHSESGKHEVAVQPWAVWARRVRVKPLRSAATAKGQIEAAAEALGARPAALPWPVKGAGR